MSGGAAPVVAVVIASLRVDEHLAEAISSVVDDAIASDISVQVVVVVDGPHDPLSSSLLREFGASVLFTGRRAGAAVAANMGIAFTDSEFVARLDADDRWRPRKLRTQVDYLRANPDVVGVGTMGALIDNEGRELGEYPTQPGARVNRELSRRNPFIHSSVLIRRSALDRIGLYDPACVRMQDYELLLRLSDAGALSVIGEQLVEYRVHSNQTSSRRSGFIRLMRVIVRGRRRVAAAEGIGRFPQMIKDITYVAAQFARYAGWRRPRYLTRGVTR